MQETEEIKILWDYMKMNHKLKKADCIIGLGSTDTNVANIVAELYLKGYSNKIIFSGGLGKDTYKLWNKTEAEKFAEIAIKKGVPKEKIYLEKESTNTGDNFRFTKKIIEKANLKIKTCIVVCKPYGEKRVYAAFKKILPEYEVSIYSENTSYEEYYKSHNKEWINVLVGDIQRMDKRFSRRHTKNGTILPKRLSNKNENPTKCNRSIPIINKKRIRQICIKRH